MTEQPDVVVLGGGPAGSTAAALLARHGHRVTLVERDRFPRYRPGASLMPAAYWVLRRLGALDAVRAAGFWPKQSVRFTDADGRDPVSLFFFENNPHECSQSWQVDRATFDHLLLQTAREAGVDVREGTAALDVVPGSVRVRAADGREELLTTRVVIDATGPASLLGDRRVPDPRPPKACVWGYFQNAPRDAGPGEAGATVVAARRGGNGGFWVTPLAGGVLSAGVVADALPGDPTAAFWREVEDCPAVAARLAGAEPAAPFRTAAATPRSSMVAGDRWVTIGDAVGFFDPLFGSGVHLALRSAAMAADAVSAGLKAGDLSPGQLGAWGPEFVRGRDRLRRLVDAYYAGFDAAAFVRRHPRHRRHLIDLLAGDVFKEMIDEVWPAVEDCTAGG